MPKQTLILLITICAVIFSCNKPTKDADSDEPVIIADTNKTSSGINSEDSLQYTASLNYPGVSSVGWDAVFIAWIEDSAGTNLHNLYICQSIEKDMTDDPGKLTGIALPYWRREKSADTDLNQVDGITGASIQGPAEIIRYLKVGDVSKFRVCFEIDRSKNGNEYFYDRPSFIYKTDLIDLDNLTGSYELKLRGFMANDTEGKDFGQNPPLKEIPGFEVWKFMTDLKYITPRNFLKDESEEHSHLLVTIQTIN